MLLLKDGMEIRFYLGEQFFSGYGPFEVIVGGQDVCVGDAVEGRVGRGKPITLVFVSTEKNIHSLVHLVEVLLGVRFEFLERYGQHSLELWFDMDICHKVS